MQTPCKLLRIIFSIDKRGTETNRPKYKEIDDNAQGHTSE